MIHVAVIYTTKSGQLNLPFCLPFTLQSAKHFAFSFLIPGSCKIFFLHYTLDLKRLHTFFQLPLLLCPLQLKSRIYIYRTRLLISDTEESHLNQIVTLSAIKLRAINHCRTPCCFCRFSLNDFPQLLYVYFQTHVDGWM